MAWLATAGDLQVRWRPLAEAQGLRLAVLSHDGEIVFADVGDDARTAVLLEPRDTRLPFTLEVQPGPSPTTVVVSSPRTTLIAVLVVAGVVTLAAACGLYRATSRELALARQQRDFVSAVSHEFRTPLTSMRHLTDLLSTRGVTSEERRTHYYQLLAHETERLHRMVESLLSFGRIEAGTYAWRLDPVDPAAFVRSVVDEFRGDAAGRGREVSVDIGDDLPPITADVEALTRALWNLLDNAAKYSDAGSPIRVAARRVADGVTVEVSDRGMGVARGDQHRIFQKFVRGATRPGTSGVGIGLALVKQIVEAHGGAVGVESEVGEGSTFTVRLPGVWEPGSPRARMRS